VTSGIRSFWRALGLAPVATLALAGSMAPARAATQTGTSIMTMKQDLADREKDIHWPEGFDPSQADLFSHNALLINASCERIWSHIIDATKWPQWYPNSKDVGHRRRQCPEGRDRLSLVNLQSAGREHGQRIRALHAHRLAPGAAPTFYHTWYLKPQGDACLVVTDEVGKGKDAAHLRETDEILMHRGHDLWLATLKWMAESK